MKFLMRVSCMISLLMMARTAGMSERIIFDSVCPPSVYKTIIDISMQLLGDIDHAQAFPMPLQECLIMQDLFLGRMTRLRAAVNLLCNVCLQESFMSVQDVFYLIDLLEHIRQTCDIIFVHDEVALLVDHMLVVMQGKLRYLL